MHHAAATGVLRMASGMSGHPDSAKAAGHACAQCAEVMGTGPADLAFLFFTSHHVPSAKAITDIVRKELSAACLVGVSAESVVGGARELERTPGISVLAARLPGVRLVPFATDDVQPGRESTTEGRARLARAIGAADDLRAVFLFADPFTVPLLNLLPAMGRARVEGSVGRIIGGMASASSSPGGNALIIDDAVYRDGLVGVGVRGPVRVDCVVSQGCRPFGPTFIVTGARKNVILTLSGKPALQAVREVVSELPDEDQKLLEKGLFVGRVVNEYKERFGRDDFLIRNVAGVDENSGAVAVNDLMRIGQTVRLHLRDARTADEDLALLLDAQQLRDTPAGGVMITCNGRGTRLFDEPNHDAAAVARAFTPDRSGETSAKGGEPVPPVGPSIPLAGFFAAGEIGPVGDESFVHGHSACLALFRPDVA